MQIIDGGEEMFGALIYGDKHPRTLSFIKEQVQMPVSGPLTEMGKRLFTNVKNTFEKFNSEEALRSIRAARQRARRFFQHDIIRPLVSLDDIQQASLRMQRWIMAMPRLREIYHNQMCDGYSDSYIDLYPNEIGETHRDYRLVMNGVTSINDDGICTTRYYYDKRLDDEVDLNIYDKTDILNTWDSLNFYLDEYQRDPTSKYNDAL